MKHLFLPYKLALLAKEKGFDESCFAGWSSYLSGDAILVTYIGKMRNRKSLNNDLWVNAPLYQQIIDWFREKHSLDITPQNCIEYPLDKDLRRKGYGGNIYNHKIDTNIIGYFGKSYYEALNNAIEESFKLI